jgi:hypothetical protein
MREGCIRLTTLPKDLSLGLKNKQSKGGSEMS